MTADSLQKQSQGPAGRLFQRGQPGNPGGRRPGCRNRATLAAEVLLAAALRGEPAEVREVHMKRNAARYEVDLTKLVKLPSRIHRCRNDAGLTATLQTAPITR
jgi:hypothetical protein